MLLEYTGIASVVVSVLLIYPHFFRKHEISLTHIIHTYGYKGLLTGFFLQPLLFIVFIIYANNQIDSPYFLPITIMFVVSFVSMLLVPYTSELFHDILAFTYFVGTALGALVTPLFFTQLFIAITLVIISTQVLATVYAL